MIKVKTTTNGTWAISGINLISSDSIYLNIKKAIEEDRLDQSYLQDLTGHRAPIVIDRKEKTIMFYSF